MYDGSTRPFAQNVKLTRDVCHAAHASGVPVEAELRRVLHSLDRVAFAEVRAAMTDPVQAAEFIEQTGTDSPGRCYWLCPRDEEPGD